jgi:hypothetical protein
MKKLTILLAGLFLINNSLVAMAMGDQTVKPFTDVSKENEYYDALVYLKDKGVISGYPDGTFKPFQTINRAEFTKIVMGVGGYNPAQDPSGFDIYSSGDLAFNDLQDGAWYVPYLRQAKQKDVIGGYPDGTFKPGQEINFVEAAKIIVVADGGDFAGAGYEGDQWFRKYVNILETNNAIPTTINIFDQKITRGEMAEIIYRLDSDNVGKASMTYDLLAVPKGYLEGSLSFPSEGIPDELMVCADNIEMAETFCTYSRIKDSKYMYGLGYRLPLKPGTYNVYAFYGAMTGLYSNYVLCGMSSNCSDHSSVNVDVDEGQTIKDIDPADWYSQN